MTALINYLYRTVLRKGTTGGHWSWFVVALAAHILRKDKAHRAQSAETISLKRGERYLISLGESPDSPTR